MSEIQQNKSYTADELKGIIGEEKFNTFITPLTSVPEPTKSVVYSYNDLDDESKNVYSSLYLLLSSLNNANFNLFALGDRVIGKWRNQEETNNINLEYGTNLQITPYEYWTTAEILPRTGMYSALNADSIVALTPPDKTHMVIIPPPTL